MCTVTYVRSIKCCFITSSRDENNRRPNAFAPGIYEHNGVNILYPKDSKANGTWIACTQTGNAAVLLNGAFEKHIPQTTYRKSRGLIFLDIISDSQPECHFLGMNLYNIEPFTLVLFTNGLLFEARWDGEQKYFKQLDEKENHIWSSATLYTHEVIDKRKKWFEEWQVNTPEATAADIFNFHRFGGDGDIKNSILMNRHDEMLTVSITGIELNTGFASMHHLDLKENKHYRQALSFETVAL